MSRNKSLLMPTRAQMITSALYALATVLIMTTVFWLLSGAATASIPDARLPFMYILMVCGLSFAVVIAAIVLPAYRRAARGNPTLEDLDMLRRVPFVLMGKRGDVVWGRAIRLVHRDLAHREQQENLRRKADLIERIAYGDWSDECAARCTDALCSLSDALSACDSEEVARRANLNWGHLFEDAITVAALSKMVPGKELAEIRERLVVDREARPYRDARQSRAASEVAMSEQAAREGLLVVLERCGYPVLGTQRRATL